MPLWFDIATVAFAIFGVSLLFALALGRSAKRADEAVESSPEVAELVATLGTLSTVRSPTTGRRFFPTPYARRELAEMVYDVLRVA